MPRISIADDSRVERVQLSERDTLRVLDLIENPPAPTPRLLRAAKSFQSHR